MDQDAGMPEPHAWGSLSKNLDALMPVHCMVTEVGENASLLLWMQRKSI